MKVAMLPHFKDIKGESGINRVIEAYFKYLPDFGVKLVDPEVETYDLRAVHAGMTGAECEVAHLHGIYFTADYPAPDWEYRVNSRIVLALRHARQVTIPSSWVAEVFQRDMRFTPAVVPHGIDWDEWQHDQPHGDYVLWNKNRIGDVCDPLPLLELARAFPKGHFVTTFLPHRTPGTPNVNATGIIPHAEMKKMVQSCLVYLATTKETFGIGVLEAMASGVPVLGYAHGGILDLVQHGVNGYLAPPDDHEALAEGLDYCIRHRAVLGANGRELARKWTWPAAVEKVAQVYRAALEPEPATVGVVIPVYNKTEEELGRAVESVINQTHRAESIVIVDDGSQDAGVAENVAGLYRDAGRNLVLHRQDNRGVAVARNRGIELLGHTTYVCCLDADDWLEPDFLRVCVKALESERSLGIAYTGLHWHKPDGTDGVSPWPGPWDYDQQLQRKNQIPTACVFRRVMWQRLGGYRARYAPGGCGSEDAELWTRAGAYGYGAAKVSEEALFNYSWLSGQVTGDPNYSEPDWLAWHPWSRDDLHPFASYAVPKRASHPVRQYDQPYISVIIPVGPGHEREVINALDSLEAQTFRKWEVIVVIDTSWDVPNTPELRQLTKVYPYAKMVYTKGEQGAGVARNRGADVARGPFVLFLDADDWLYPECLEHMVNVWNEAGAIIYTDYVGKAIVEDLTALAPELQERVYAYNEKKREAVIGYRAAEFDYERALRQPEGERPYIWCNVTALVPTDWHRAIGGFDETMESWEDVDYHYRHVRAGHDYLRIPRELMVYRFQTGTRRQDGLQKHRFLVKYLRDKYEEIEVMPCAGCGGKRRATTSSRSAAAPFAAAIAMAADEADMTVAVMPLALGGTMDIRDGDLLKVRYASANRGSHRVVGRNSGIDYRYRKGGDVFLVHSSDVDGRLFQRLDDAAPVPPAHEREVLDEPEALPGVEVEGLPEPDRAEPRPPTPIEQLDAMSFEPTQMTVRQIEKFVKSGKASPRLLGAMLEEERAGKKRVTAIAALEEALR